jgi:hypothetical protein
VREIVVPSKTGVCFEFVMSVQAWFAAGERRVDGGAVRGVAADAEFLGGDVAIGQGEAESGEEVGEVVANVVDVLLSVD